MNHTDKGYFGEQLAMAWLLKNGYWVFKNLAPQGPVDCVAINQKTNEIILVDVKVLSHHKGGYTRSKILNDKQKQMNVKKDLNQTSGSKLKAKKGTANTNKFLSHWCGLAAMR